VKIIRGIRKCVQPIWPRFSLRRSKSYLRFWRDYADYWKLQGEVPCALADLEPQLGDWHATTPLTYYFYQDVWAFHKIIQRKPDLHVDIGSTALLVGCLAALVKTISLDIRPLTAKVPGLLSVSGAITQLPFATGSIRSISSLCVVEHVGLGRYGDPLDPNGTLKACRDLTRVLAGGGDLYVSAPCGRSYVAFNAHRSFQKTDFLSMFEDLSLVEFVLVNNCGRAEQFNPDPKAGLHVGLFHFTK